MNLKEAFRYQNKIQRLMDEAKCILRLDRNVIKVENTALRHKVNPEAENETTVEMPDTEYAEQITEITVFLMFLLKERERLSHAIRAAKQAMDIDFDGEVSIFLFYIFEICLIFHADEVMHKPQLAKYHFDGLGLF